MVNVEEFHVFQVTKDGEVLVKTETREEANHYCAGYLAGWEAAERYVASYAEEQAQSEEPEEPAPVEPIQSVEYEVFEDVEPLEANEDLA